MDNILPQELAGALGCAGGRAERGAPRYHVVAGDRTHSVVAFDRAGFVIEADGRPPLRGFADIIRGTERIIRGLVVCAWARHGRVGYEFKREGNTAEVPADFVRPAHSGLIEDQR